MKKHYPFLGLLLLAVLLFSGCTAMIDVNYIPASELKANGTVSIGEFTYSAATTRKLEPNEIEMTNPGTIYLHAPVGEIFQGALIKELRYVGITVKDDTDLELKGDIQDFLVDALGFSAMWTLNVRYTVRNKTTGAVVYEDVKKLLRRSGKFWGFERNLSGTLRFNIEDLIGDPKFIEAIK